MSAYVLMKILESSPRRYDRGIRILTLGKLDESYDRLVSYVREGDKVLDIGCGTGALTLRAAQRGARVKGIDVNPEMLEIARSRAEEAGLADSVELCEMGVAELGDEDPDSYDVVMSGLCLSELTKDELNYTLSQIWRVLRPGGLLLVADETVPRSVFKRMINWLVRVPLVVITYIVAQMSTRPIRGLPEELSKRGFVIRHVSLSRMENFIELVAEKPDE
jgi:demethylmenaquinone methyltransferase/2-methoxy-6-polyprenyl-1,4-benzoquinol methylase